MNPFAFPSSLAGSMNSSASSASTTTTASSSSALTTTTASNKAASKDSEENNFGGLGTLGVAASQAASLGMNQASKLNHIKKVLCTV